MNIPTSKYSERKIEECSGEEFSAQLKKILVEEFSGENFSDKECSNE
jgi:hypothetical protein